MDQEPMHLLQAMQGMMVVLTNDYLMCEGKMLMFQLIGVPYLNQKAREVAPKMKSLTTSGLYILFTPRMVYFWVGSEYSRRFLELSDPHVKRNLLSDGLFLRLMTTYKRDVLSQMDQDEDSQGLFKYLAKAKIQYEGDESKKFLKSIKGELQDDQEDTQGSATD